MFDKQGFAEMWEQRIVPAIFRPWAEDLLGRARPLPGERILDLACGTGIVIRTAYEAGAGRARSAGLDVNPGMVALARSIAPHIEWFEASAVEVPFEAGSFDLVTCQQGLQFFPDASKALAEVRRVLAPGGRAAFSTWAPIERHPVLCALRSAASSHVDIVPDRRHSLGEIEQVRALFEGAGFTTIEVTTIEREAVHPDGTWFLGAHLMPFVPALATMDAATRETTVAAILSDARPALERFFRGEALVEPTVANVVIARP